MTTTTILTGNPVPNFSFTSTFKDYASLSDLKGKKIVLFFYPKDNTPGCTQEAKEFRDYYQKFKKLNTEILGVSRDSLKSHENFICKQELPFPLISDHDEKICNLFEVIKPKNMYGKMVKGIERSTFLINEKGILDKEWRKVKVDGHVEEVLTAIMQSI